jgi:glycosyltransferase involved in cell wall biosynthesis
MIMPRARAEAPQLSVVLCTYNRGELLEAALRALLEQSESATPSFEILVVDNNSSDETRQIVQRVATADCRVRYIFEPHQGLSYARNAGIRGARAPLIAFTDDDVRVTPDWVAAVVRAFQEHPDADLVGGRVLPVWPSCPPAWLTREHWAPLALADFGEAPLAVTLERPICLLGANLALRRSVFDAVGLFASDVQRVEDGIGSVEDHEFQLRLLRFGCKGVYDPRIVVHAAVQADRLKREYHRRWHTSHGHFHALMRSEEMERTTLGTLFGVPAHLYRQALADFLGWMRATMIHQPAQAFHHETRLRFFAGFFQTRRREFLGTSRRRIAAAAATASPRQALMQRAGPRVRQGH